MFMHIAIAFRHTVDQVRGSAEMVCDLFLVFVELGLGLVQLLAQLVVSDERGAQEVNDDHSHHQATTEGQSTRYPQHVHSFQNKPLWFIFLGRQ